jgi:hypothetical protein
MKTIHVFLAIALLLVPIFALASEAGEVESVALTIYNDNLALIREVRAFDLERGVQDLVLSEVSGQLTPETVHLSMPSVGGVELLEQNYDYDLVSRDKLMEKFIGKEIYMVDDERGIEYAGTLLSVAGGLVLESDGQILLNPPGRVVLPQGAADELLLKPTLSWQLYSPKTVKTDAEITYLSGGLSWNADYVLQLNADDSAAGMEGWVTLSNYSGTTYRDAELKLIAGEVNRVPEYKDMMRAAPMAEMAMDGLGGGGFEEEEFFEYHLYDLGRTTTVRNNQQKQIGLLSAQEVPIEKLFLFDGQYGGDMQVMVEFTNEEESGMGMPLPEGTVRVFKADSEGDVQFVGEDWIEHTPRDEDVRLYIGNAFDIVGETIQTNYEDIGDGYKESYSVELRNHKEKEKVVVTVQVHVWGDWKIINSNYDYTMKDAWTAEFLVPVKADDEANLTYTYKVTWE